MNAPNDPRQNGLIAALTEDEWQKIGPHLELVELPLGKIVTESDAPARHVYFPTTAIVSLVYLMESGSTTEIAVVGREGMVGVAVILGGASMPTRAVVQSAGVGYRLEAELLKEVLTKTAPPALQLMLRYTQALVTQMAQTAACNRHHELEQQLCRWLLLSLDRLNSNKLEMTQDLIANMLGVRREGVTEAAGKLQRAGLIKYTRGKIEVLDRPGLEKRVCECYFEVKQEYDRLLPVPPMPMPVSVRPR